MKSKHILLVALLLSIVLQLPLVVANAQQRKGPQRTQMQNEVTQEENFETYLHKKCEMVIREMQLTSFDSAHFEPLYHQLQKEKFALYRKYGNIRRIRLAIDEGKPVPDSTLMRMLNNSAKLQVEDALLEQAYLTKLSRVLTPIQLFKLQQAEQKYRKDVIRQGKPAKK